MRIIPEPCVPWHQPNVVSNFTDLKALPAAHRLHSCLHITPPCGPPIDTSESSLAAMRPCVFFFSAGVFRVPRKGKYRGVFGCTWLSFHSVIFHFRGCDWVHATSICIDQGAPRQELARQLSTGIFLVYVVRVPESTACKRWRP